MKFHEMKYERPNFDSERQEMQQLLSRMKAAKTASDFFDMMREFNKKMERIETMSTICSIRNSIDTTDAFYEQEKEVFDSEWPSVELLAAELRKIRLESPFKKEMDETFGTYLLERDQLQAKMYSPEILEDRVEENKLVTEYEKLMASAEIEFNGEIYNLSGMTYFAQSPDRETRKAANLAKANWLSAHVEEFDRLYDELVKIRHRIAQKLGYENYIPVAYALMGRTDWTAKDAKAYRKQIVESIVPVAQKYYKEQSKRIGISDMKNYDYSLMFLSGNPTPKGEEPFLVDAAKKMYHELSPETDEFFHVMVENELMDLTTKKGKAGGGYCATLEEYKLPFIFSNFNKTSHDVDVLTHEAGHAFQAYVGRDIYPPDYRELASEVAEIHSMSMEFFAHPWMESFFKEDAEKYFYNHVVGGLYFIPYGASIDEFQEYVYENPTATPAERRAKYREIEKKYLPHLDYDGIEYLEGGGRWQQQAHVYGMPFYYLDYTISQVCAFQYFVRDLKDHKEAWDSYLKLCRLGGTRPFTELAKASGLDNPFEEGTLAKVVPHLESYLSTLDAEKLK